MPDSQSAFHPFFQLSGVFVIGALLVTGAFAKRGWLDWRRIVRQKMELEYQIELVQNEKRTLAHNILQLKRNPEARERLVRSVLGYVRTSEFVIDLP